MRTKTLVLSAIVGALSSASLMAQVYSLNAVGYINVTVPPGYSILANQLNTTNNNISPLLDSQVADGSKDGVVLFKFNGSSYTAIVADQYNGPIYGGTSPWDGPATSTTLNPGEAVFVHNQYSTNLTFTFVGTVLQGSLTNTLPVGFSLVSSLVPQAGRLDADLGMTEVDGDIVFIFNNATGNYLPYPGDQYNGPTYGGPAPWDAPSGQPVYPTVSVGQGFFYKAQPGNGANTWVRSFTVN
jgi:hypothetical protein